MANNRQLSVGEMKRILKPGGMAYLSLGFPPPLGLVNNSEWEEILKGFKVESRGGKFEKWAVVSPK